MKFEAFERRAHELWAEIPAEYQAGVDGLEVERAAKAHPTLADVYTLGECLTESWPSDFGGPDTTRSFVVLYYGSFWRLSRQEEGFDWEGELWETLTHELQHHLESLATEDRLEEIDYAADENFKREQGEPFDPLFFRSGESLGEGWYRIEEDYFVELSAAPADRVVALEWQGASYRIALPPDRPEVLFLDVNGVRDAPAGLTAVVMRPERLRERLRRLMRRRPLAVASGFVDAAPLVEPEPGDE